MPPQVWIVVGVAAVLAALVVLLVIGQFVNLYIQALLCNAHIPMIELIAMRFRKTDIRAVVLNRIRSERAGLGLSARDLETHLLAGGRLSNVVGAMIAARHMGIDLGWQEACARDLEGHDVLAEIERRPGHAQR